MQKPLTKCNTWKKIVLLTFKTFAFFLIENLSLPYSAAILLILPLLLVFGLPGAPFCCNMPVLKDVDEYFGRFFYQKHDDWEIIHNTITQH